MGDSGVCIVFMAKADLLSRVWDDHVVSASTQMHKDLPRRIPSPEPILLKESIEILKKLHKRLKEQGLMKKITQVYWSWNDTSTVESYITNLDKLEAIHYTNIPLLKYDIYVNIMKIESYLLSLTVSHLKLGYSTYNNLHGTNWTTIISLIQKLIEIQQRTLPPFNISDPIYELYKSTISASMNILQEINAHKHLIRKDVQKPRYNIKRRNYNPKGSIEDVGTFVFYNAQHNGMILLYNIN